MADQAFDLITKFEPSEYFPDNLLQQKIHIDELGHTIGKEVHMLFYYNAKTRKDQNMRIRDATRHLKRDIDGFSHHLTRLTLRV